MDRSSWADYKDNLISKGGGIYSRHAKQIKLSAEVRQMLGTIESSMQPLELIRAILRMQVDLLWNGGIGTYVKARVTLQGYRRRRQPGPHAARAGRI